MPELPDLVYIVKRLAPEITGRLITAVTVKQPIVIRMMTGGSFAETLSGRRLLSLERRGPFLVFTAEPQVPRRPLQGTLPASVSRLNSSSLRINR